ncbi:hypothetical protein F383_12394 [Gossypium arboreum]|uniref:Uncharacterized protein n=1 Tax=Gossypium arboreum TaxID=29729 RepID=A0A0B0PW30_GOSAR|nr:hypothetical protein F383_23435 [Gossypium arboreum]KHG30673.1 hypothetical protein F383_12394 [Gossypium arboreum]
MYRLDYTFEMLDFGLCII